MMGAWTDFAPARKTLEDSPQGGAGAQRALGSPLNDRAVRERVGKGNTEFDHVHARPLQGNQQAAGSVERGIARREVHHQSFCLAFAQFAETGFNAGC